MRSGRREGVRGERDCEIGVGEVREKRGVGGERDCEIGVGEVKERGRIARSE